MIDPKSVPGHTLAASLRHQLFCFAPFLLLVVFVFIAYWPVLFGPFIWDDRLLIENNPLVKGKHSIFSIWFRDDFPLSIVTFWLQWRLWGTHAMGYHIVNVLLHALNCVLVWRVLRCLEIPGAWLGAAIFAVHPVCVASVAWISELKNTLSLFWFLLSVLCFLRFDHGTPEAESSNGKTPIYWLALIAFMLSLLSKTSTVMLPVIL